jgi:hypothetical protein
LQSCEIWGLFLKYALSRWRLVYNLINVCDKFNNQFV